MREAFPNGSRHLDFQTPFEGSNARNVMSSSSSSGGCENLWATRCWWAARQEVQQEVQAEVQLGDKMAAGDSAER